MLHCEDLTQDEHRVLGQLTRSAKSVNHVVRNALLPDRANRSAKRLNMDSSLWNDLVQELIYSGYVDAEDFHLYVIHQCICEQGEGLPRLGSSKRLCNGDEPVQGPGWGRYRSVPLQPQTRARPAGAGRGSPIGRPANTPSSSTNSNKTHRHADSSKRKDPDFVPRSHVEEEPPDPVTMRDLAAHLWWLWKQAADQGRMNGLVQGQSSRGEFAKQLTLLKERLGVDGETVKVMLEVYVDMLATRQIKLNGKPAWRVFLSKSEVLLEHARRRVKHGKSKAMTVAESDQRLDKFFEALDKP
jgi:hypothetical protein